MRQYKDLTPEQARLICKRFTYYVEINHVKEARQRCSLCPLRRMVKTWIKDHGKKKEEITTTGFCAYELKDICPEVMDEEIEHWEELEKDLLEML